MPGSASMKGNVSSIIRARTELDDAWQTSKTWEAMMEKHNAPDPQEFRKIALI